MLKLMKSTIIQGCHFFVQLMPYEKYTLSKNLAFYTEVGGIPC